MFASTLTNH